MVIIFNKNFTKEYEKLSKSIQDKFELKFILFQQDTQNPILKKHRLQGNLKQYFSINITGDIRAIYKEENDSIIFIAIGSHSNLYK